MAGAPNLFPRGLELAKRFRNRAAVVCSALAARVLDVGYPEEQDAAHTERGQEILKAFLFDAAGCRPTW